MDSSTKRHSVILKTLMAFKSSWIRWGVTLVALSFCTTSIIAEPKWYKNLDNTGYATKKYMIGFGKADSYDKAISEAQSEIAAQFEIDVRSSYTQFSKESQENFNFTSKSKKKSRLKTMTDQTISGIEIVKRQKVDDVYYILAVLNKNDFAKRTKNDINDLIETVLQTVNLARHYEKAGAPKKALITLTEALSQSEKIDDLNELLSVVGDPIELKPDVTQPGIKLQKQTILDGITIDILSGQNQKVELGQRFKNPIVISVMYKGSSINDFPIIASYASKENIPITYIPETFKYEVRPYGLPNSKGTYVNLTFDVNLIPAVLRQDFREKQLLVAYTVSDLTSSPIQLRVNNTPNASDSTLTVNTQELTDLLTEKLKEFGLTPTTSSAIKLSADVAIVSIKKTGGYFKPYFVVKTTCLLSVLSRDKRIGLIELSGQGVGSSQEAAISNSYQHYKLTPDTLLESIAKAKYLEPQ